MPRGYKTPDRKIDESMRQARMVNGGVTPSRVDYRRLRKTNSKSLTVPDSTIFARRGSWKGAARHAGISAAPRAPRVSRKFALAQMATVMKDSRIWRNSRLPNTSEWTRLFQQGHVQCSRQRIRDLFGSYLRFARAYGRYSGNAVMVKHLRPDKKRATGGVRRQVGPSKRRPRTPTSVELMSDHQLLADFAENAGAALFALASEFDVLSRELRRRG